MSNILITGGLGFIGSHLAKQLINDNHNVRIIDNADLNINHIKKRHKELNENCEILNVDIFDAKSEYYKNIDYIFHLAAKKSVYDSFDYPRNYFYNNVNGTLEVFLNAKFSGIKKIFYAASASCYDECMMAANEYNDIKCSSMYALSKYVAEKLLFDLQKMYCPDENSVDFIDIKSFRIFNAYGDKNSSSFIDICKYNNIIDIFGNGHAVRSYIHIDDIIKGLIVNMDSKFKIINLYGENKNLNQIVKLLPQLKKIHYYKEIKPLPFISQGTSILYIPKLKMNIKKYLSE